MRLYLGYDSAEAAAFNVAVKSLRKHSDIGYEPLEEDKLRATGLYTRTVDKRGQMYDMPSNAPCSTEFATSRFLVPTLCQSGWAMFTDCDVLFLADPQEIMQHADNSKAVMVVKHNHAGLERSKIGGMEQTAYSRKNWSSVMIFNCDHPANKRLSLRDVNERPGRDLHGFYWLNDEEIGELPREWNWLVNVTERPKEPKIAHFTLGGPWVEGWEASPHDDLWLKYAEDNVVNLALNDRLM